MSQKNEYTRHAESRCVISPDGRFIPEEASARELNALLARAESAERELNELAVVRTHSGPSWRERAEKAEVDNRRMREALEPLERDEECPRWVEKIVREALAANPPETPAGSPETTEDFSAVAPTSPEIDDTARLQILFSGAQVFDCEDEISGPCGYCCHYDGVDYRGDTKRDAIDAAIRAGKECVS